MTVKRIATKQYQAIVDSMAASIDQRSNRSPEGWIATVRKALGMSAAQLARRLGVTRARISKAEKAELSGSVSIKSMQGIAQAMGCRFVYAIVPAEGRIESVVFEQAHKKAQALVARASGHMSLEDQSLTSNKNLAEVDRLAEELVREMPAHLWDDK